MSETITDLIKLIQSRPGAGDALDALAGLCIERGDELATLRAQLSAAKEEIERPTCDKITLEASEQRLRGWAYAPDGTLYKALYSDSEARRSKAESELSSLRERCAGLEKVTRANIATMQEQVIRFAERDLPHYELDCAIEESRAALTKEAGNGPRI